MSALLLLGFAAGRPVPAHAAATVGLKEAALSAEARRVIDWVVRSKDNGNLPFLVVDKINARLFLLDADGTMRATTPVLLGLARGDISPPGIGTRPLSAITPAERITPAGRFVVEAGLNMAGNEILWIDYDAAISLHRASDRKPGMAAKSRVERLASATAAEKRVSLGCINVSTPFYDNFIKPTFSGTKGIAYILPEMRSAVAHFEISGDDLQNETTANTLVVGAKNSAGLAETSVQ